MDTESNIITCTRIEYDFPPFLFQSTTVLIFFRVQITLSNSYLVVESGR